MPSVCSKSRDGQINEREPETVRARPSAPHDSAWVRVRDWLSSSSSVSSSECAANSSTRTRRRTTSRPSLRGVFPRALRHSARLLVVFLLQTSVPAAEAAKVDFNRDIRPIMADTCFRCHGFDEKARKAGLRLDVRLEALKPANSGAIPIVPGQPQQSEVIRRLFTQDADEQMPPARINQPLTAPQKELFRRWIAEGAEYRDHWAFLPPQSVPLPKVIHAAWPTTPSSSLS